MERQVSRADYQQAVQEIVRGRKQRTAGFRLLVLGGFLLPSGLDFVPPKSSLHFNHIVELLGVPIAAIGGYLASVGHKHVREGESVVLRMTLRGLAAW